MGRAAPAAKRLDGGWSRFSGDELSGGETEVARLFSPG